MEVKPLLFSHIPNIFGKISSFIAFYKLLLSEIKIQILINTWHFYDFLDEPTAALQVATSIFSKNKRS